MDNDTIGLVDPSCDYHTIKSVKAPKPPIYKNVTFLPMRGKEEGDRCLADLDDDIHNSILKNIAGRTMRVQIRNLHGSYYAYLPGACIPRKYFKVRKK